MNDFEEKLKEYFRTTPRKKVLEDWDKSKNFDKIGPTVNEFLKNSWKCYEIHTVQARMYGCSFQCKECKIKQQNN